MINITNSELSVVGLWEQQNGHFLNSTLQQVLSLLGYVMYMHPNVNTAARYFGHLDEAAERRAREEREEAARKRQEHLEQRQREEQAKQEAARLAAEKEAAMLQAKKGGLGQEDADAVNPNGLDFVPNDFLKGLIDEVYFGEEDSDDDTVQEVAGTDAQTEVEAAAAKKKLAEQQRKHAVMRKKSQRLYEAEQKKIKRSVLYGVDF